VITSVMTPRMPKFKTIAPLGAWRHMCEMYLQNRLADFAEILYDHTY